MQGFAPMLREDMNTLKIISSAALAACMLAALPAAAQEYPAREIRAICSFAAGSGGDILVRYYSDRLAKVSGKPVIVENRVGAQGVIGTEAAAKARPDGYTILIAPVSSTLAAAPYLFKKLPYDPLKDFTPIAPISSLNFVIAVDGKSPIKTVGELVGALKKKPDHGSFGINNNTGQVAAELFKEMAGLKSVQIPYTTTVQGITDLTGGQLDFVVGDATFMSGQARAGRIRLIAVTGTKRSAALPEVPTMAESGFPGYDVSAWWGVVAPAGTPKPIVDRLAGWIAQINATEETRKFLHNVSTDVLNGTPESMAAMIKQDMDRWGRYVKIARIEPQ
jgi:tripartite-type tricarboxylate transporter receptor subunit TctC